MFTKTAVSSALVGLAAAANVAPTVPVSAQIGALDFGVTCTLPILGNYTFGGLFTATAPIQAVSGQQIYYTDLIAKITIPGSITGLAGFVGATQAAADVKVALNLENASPAKFDVFPGNGLHLEKIQIKPGQPTTARVPVSGVLAPIGPITMGRAGLPHVIRIGVIDIGIYVQDSTGRTIIGPIPVHCPESVIPYDIGLVNVLDASLGAENFPSAPTVGETGVFAPVTDGLETGSFRFPYTCNFQDVFQTDIDLAISGTIPTYTKPGQQVNIKDAYAYLRVPSAASDFVKSVAPNASKLRITANTFNIGTVNGSPAQLNILKTPQTNTITIQDGQGFEFALPRDQTLVAGPFTAGKAGDELSFTAQDTAGTIDVLDEAGANVVSVTFACKPKYDSLLIGIPVTTLTAPAINK